jgi:hypothetical protein
MDQSLIFQPMGALVALTFVVLLLIPIRRFSAGFSGRVKAADFKYGESANVPPEVAIPNRNYMNLLELPLLFYVFCLTLYVSNRVDQIFLNLAWTYFGLRTLHSLVHLTFNNVMVRLTAFAASNVVLGVMWARFFLRV